MSETIIRKMSEGELQEVKWLWKPYIPLGKLIIIQGEDTFFEKRLYFLNFPALPYERLFFKNGSKNRFFVFYPLRRWLFQKLQHPLKPKQIKERKWRNVRNNYQKNVGGGTTRGTVVMETVYPIWEARYYSGRSRRR